MILKRISILFLLLILLNFSFADDIWTKNLEDIDSSSGGQGGLTIIAEPENPDAIEQPPEEPVGNDIISWLRVLNRNIVLNNIGSQSVSEDNSSSSGESQTNNNSSELSNNLSINEFNWVHPNDSTEKLLAFPRVRLNGKNYQLKILLGTDNAVGALKVGIVINDDFPVDCGTGKTWAGNLFNGTSGALNLSIGTDVTCGEKIQGDISIASLNLDRFNGQSGTDTLKIRSPLIPNGTCSANFVNTTGNGIRNYSVTCSN
jgi:hypothetical protein